MAATRAEIEAQISNMVEIFEKIKDAGNVDATNIVGLEDTLIQSLEDDYAAGRATSAAAVRSQVAAAVSQSSVRSALIDGFRLYGKFINAPVGADLETLIAFVYQDFITNTQRVETRAITYGSPAAGGSNVGNGLLRRLTVDEEGFNLEGLLVSEAHTAECIADRNVLGRQHEETFELRGAEPPRDALNILGTGEVTQIKSMSVATGGLVTNGSFSNTSGTGGSSLVVTDWTLASGAQADLDVSATVYRNFENDSTKQSLNLTGNVKLTQSIETNGRRFVRNRPYWWQLAVQRQASCDGTLTIRVGSNATASVDLTTHTNSTWELLIPTLNKNLWPRNFTENDLDIEIELSGNTTGNVLIQDVVLAPMIPHAGTYYALVGGDTEFLLKDSFSHSDSETGAKNQLWIARATYVPGTGGLYLPHDTGTPVTWADL